MHRNSRKRSDFIWPGCAVLVIAILLLMRFGGNLQDHSAEAMASINRLVSTRIAPRPYPLEHPSRQASSISPADQPRRQAARPSAGRSAQNRAFAGQPIDLWDGPQRPTSVASLSAPLLQPREELAGWETQAEGATAPSRELKLQSVAALTTPRTATVLTPLQRSDVGPLPNAWPATPALDRMLKRLQQHDAPAEWGRKVERRLSELQRLPAIGDTRAAPILEALQDLADRGQQAAEQVENRPLQVLWLRVAHSVARRVAVWQPVWDVNRRDADRDGSGGDSFRVDMQGVADRAAKVAALCEQTGDAEAWRYYLLLHRITDSFQPTDAARRRVTAQRFLSRIEWDGLTEPQRQWMQQPAIEALADAIRPWASGPVDYPRLLAQIERQETDAIDLVGIRVAATTQTLRFAAGPLPKSVAAAINTYYRNANLRVAISKEILNRLLPDVPDRTQPIHQRILGTDVRGTSRVSSDLEVDLVPDQNAWSLILKTRGTVLATTTGVNGIVRVRNRSNGDFTAQTPMWVTDRGVELAPSNADVSQEMKLRSLRTQYDGFPLIGSLVRGIAMREYIEASPRSRRIAESRMRRKLTTQIDRELQEQVDAKTRRLTDQLLGPLAQLRLDPTVVDMETSAERLIARYRLAGDWQLAAFTPRPRAMSDSLLSMQVHQSALNNAFERLLPSEAPQPIRSVASDLMQMFGRDRSQLPSDLPEDISVQFTRTRPITAEIDDGTLWLTFRIMRLRGERGPNLSRFIVRVGYRGVTDGLQARLVREGSLSISGPRMSLGQRVAVRAIFNKVLHEDQPLPLTSEKLIHHPATASTSISQLELRDGWLALAIAPAETQWAREPAGAARR